MAVMKEAEQALLALYEKKRFLELSDWLRHNEVKLAAMKYSLEVEKQLLG